jgi:O-antigen ligase
MNNAFIIYHHSMSAPHGPWIERTWGARQLLLADNTTAFLWQAGGPVLLVLCLAKSYCCFAGGRGFPGHPAAQQQEACH